MAKGSKKSKDSFFMCRPDHFGVNYVINPWMKGNVGKTDQRLAVKQWEKLYEILNKHADILLIDPEPGLPDMVFTANSGLVMEDRVLLSRFAYIERSPEEKLYSEWFESHGYTVQAIPGEFFFEGGGDALYDYDRRWLWTAYGHRTSIESHPHLAKGFSIEVVSLRLIDPRFYHLDTCLLPLPGGGLLYYPGAFDVRSNLLIEEKIEEPGRIAIGQDEALCFAANSVITGKTLIMNRCTSSLRERLEATGLDVVETDLSEFIKAGGSAKCLTLRLNEAPGTGNVEKTTVITRRVIAEGHLLDSKLMGRICDIIIDEGASFNINEMNLGKKRDDPSSAEIEITAPSVDKLDSLVRKILLLGARLPHMESLNAVAESAITDGVAPDNFYSTTIYPTQVRVDGKWIDVENRRMDAVVVISGGSASCRLLRDIRMGDIIVTGADGVRVNRGASVRKQSESFSFMGSHISSERKVESVIERVAWDMNRIRLSGGRIVVVPGPVVVHTGVSQYLAWMLRNGYFQALLGGNAVAVHDLEYAMFGTSLGIDLKSGTAIEGGHRNHMAAINSIRRSGSIENAVEDNTLSSGIFYELVKNDIPYSLAGSIRDDGPLPETEMDLIKAQGKYAELLKGAGMVLMLGTMLHSIGTGNMTPSGVKLICVDINPTVVTKLTDRGSLESVGIVTDVGLFMIELKRKLEAFDESKA